MAVQVKKVPLGAETTKVWIATKDSVAGFGLKTDEAIMAGTEKNFVAASKVGVAFVGTAISFVTRAENIKEGGLFMWMPSEMRMFPSTIVSPIPAVMPSVSMPGMIKVIQGELPSFLSYLAAIGG